MARLSLGPCGLTSRRCRVHFMLRTTGVHSFPRRILRFSTLGRPRALGACYVALWRLPRPDLHRLADGDLSRHTRPGLGSGTGRDSALAWAFVPFLLCLVGLSLPLCRTIECLPQTLNRIRIKCGVGTHNRHLFHYRLGDDQPIKRITMMQRQCRYRDKMGNSD